MSIDVKKSLGVQEGARSTKMPYILCIRRYKVGIGQLNMDKKLMEFNLFRVEKYIYVKREGI